MIDQQSTARHVSQKCHSGATFFSGHLRGYQREKTQKMIFIQNDFDREEKTTQQLGSIWKNFSFATMWTLLDS